MKLNRLMGCAISALMLGSGLVHAQDTPPAKPAAKSNAAQDEAGEPRVNTAQRAATKPVRSSKTNDRAAADRVDLDTTTVTGNRELPKVMYVVPWKRSDIGDSMGRPANSLLDEVLAPVDRDVFRREVSYYQALQPDAATKAPAAGSDPPASR